jgi:hypothetical protein
MIETLINILRMKIGEAVIFARRLGIQGNRYFHVFSDYRWGLDW